MKKRINWRACLGSRELYGKTIRLALPISAQSLVAVGMNMVDTVMLAKMGDAQISASSLAGQYVTLFLVCAMGLGMGASVLTNRYWGMGDSDSLKKAVTVMLRWELLVTVVFTVVGLLFPRGIMRVFSSDEEILRYGTQYLRWLLPAYFCMAYAQGCTIVLRSAGKLLIPLVGSVLALGVNVGLNWLLIHGNLGAPRMEIAGAALATTAAWMVQLLFICGYFFFAEQKIGYRLSDLKTPCGTIQKEYFRISLPVLVSDGLLGLGSSAVSMVMGQMGQTFAAANSVTMVVQQLSTVLHHGTAGAAGVITGHTMGEGDFERAQQQGYFFVLTGAVIGLLAAAGIMLLRRPVIAYYDVTMEAKEIAWQLLNALLVVVVFQSVNGVLTKGVLRAGGDTRFLMMADVLFLWAASIPLGVMAAFVWKMPAVVVFELLKVDQIIKCIWCLLRLRSGK
ncbi:MAG: MATE family efflux transporter, partial [Oscillospiraceae bacterium]|nr:MATE family efflux transporter [Oscillospiraceae bacterium]